LLQPCVDRSAKSSSKLRLLKVAANRGLIVLFGRPRSGLLLRSFSQLQPSDRHVPQAGLIFRIANRPRQSQTVSSVTPVRFRRHGNNSLEDRPLQSRNALAAKMVPVRKKKTAGIPRLIRTDRSRLAGRRLGRHGLPFNSASATIARMDASSSDGVHGGQPSHRYLSAWPSTLCGRADCLAALSSAIEPQDQAASACSLLQ
jgi:hypothetical protein